MRLALILSGIAALIVSSVATKQVEAAGTIRTTTIVTVRHASLQLRTGSLRPTLEVLYAINAAHGRKHVHAWVNGYRLPSKSTNRHGVYVQVVPEYVLRIRRGQENHFRFLRPNGSVNNVRIRNHAHLRSLVR